MTCDDFRAAMADANNVNLDQLAQWYLQAGTPTLTVESVFYDSDLKQFRLRLSQSIPGSPENPPLCIPVLVGLIGRKSKKDIVPAVVRRIRNF